MSRPEASLEQIRNAFDRAVYGAERRAWIIGLLGMVNTDGSTSIHVPDRLGWVFVTTGPTGGQMVTIARNDGKVPIRAQMPVRMKRGDDGALIIFDVFNSGGFTDSGMSGDYENNFGAEWHHHRIGSGLEFEFEGLMHERGRARPTTGMLAYMNAFRYYHGSVWKTWEGDTIDLTGYQPAGAGNHAWVVIGIDPVTNTATATTGPAVSVATELTYTDVNNVPFEGIPVAAVLVRNDSSSIQDISLFIDVHEWFAGLHYSKLGDLGDVDESAGYYGIGPYSNDNLYYYGAGGYEWVTGGHKINMGAVKQLTLVDGVVDLSDGPTFGFIDLIGEGSADDTLIGMLNGRIGDMVALHVSDPITNGEIIVAANANFDLGGDITLNSTSDVLLLVYTDSGWCQPFRPPLVNAMVTIPKSFEHYVDVKERLLENNVHGGLDVLATAQPLDSVPTDLPVTAGISKLLIAVIAGGDFDGEITVTGTSVNRDTGTETPADTDIITIDALTTDASGTDGNGNVTHAFTGAYITSKWFKGAVVLSTANLTLSDVDVYQISFEQFGDVSDISLEAVDVTALATNSSAWMDLHLYSVAVTGSKVNITNEGTLELLASEVTLDKRYRKRLGDLSIPLDGTTDGFWFDAFWGPLANIYWEDINAKIWYTQQIDVVGDMVPGYYTNYIDFNVDYADGVQEGRLQWNIDDGTLEVGMPGGQVNLQLGQEMLLRCRNTTGATILNGSVVEIIGASGNRPLIDLADASDLTKISVIGMATEDIGHNSNGFVNTKGYVRDVNTNGMTVGEPVWLSASTPGAYTQTRPTAPDFSYAIGIVIVAGAGNGIVYNGPIPSWRMMDSSDVLFDASPSDGEYLAFNLSNGRFELTAAPTSGVTSHGALTDLGVDDHSIYALLAGRVGGQTLYGDTASGGDLTLISTVHATKGSVIVTNGASGATISAGASDFVVENSANAGISILAPDAYWCTLLLGTATDENAGRVRWDYTNNQMTVGTGKTGGHVRFVVNNYDVEAMRILSDGTVAVGITDGDGTFHIHTASAGTVTADTQANDLVIEGSGNTGISILAPDASASQIRFGSPADNFGARLSWNYNAHQLLLETDKTTTGFIVMKTGNQVEGLLINGVQNVGIGAPPVITGRLTLFRGTGDHFNYIQNTASGTGTGNGMMFGIQSTPNAFLYQYEGNPFYIGQAGAVAIYLNASQMGVWTATPARVFDVNQGAGNMIVDGYDTHSTPEFKDLIQDMDVTGALSRLKGHKPKTWKRQPFVGTEELYKLAREEFEELPIAHGRESRDWMKGLKSGPELAFVNQERARLRAERAGNPKYTDSQYGLVADATLASQLPEIAIYEVDGDSDSPIAGYNINAYVAMLHAALIELSEQVEALP